MKKGSKARVIECKQKQSVTNSWERKIDVIGTRKIKKWFPGFSGPIGSRFEYAHLVPFSLVSESE